MSGVFAYCRMAPASELASTSRLRTMAAAKGFAVDLDNAVVEVALASLPMSARPGWRTLLERAYEGDLLIVPGLDSLGRDVLEVRATIQMLAGRGLRVYCLALERMNLAGAEGKGAMDMLAAVGALDQTLKIELMRSEVPHPKTEIAASRGRPRSLGPAQIRQAHVLLATGISVVQVARSLQTSRQTVMRLRARDKAGELALS